MSKGKHSDAEMVGALKEMEAGGRKIAGLTGRAGATVNSTVRGSFTGGRQASSLQA